MNDKSVKVKFVWICLWLFVIALMLSDVSSYTRRIAVALETIAARPLK